jgi:hypothetical protein
MVVSSGKVRLIEPAKLSGKQLGASIVLVCQGFLWASVILCPYAALTGDLGGFCIVSLLGSPLVTLIALLFLPSGIFRNIGIFVSATGCSLVCLVIGLLVWIGNQMQPSPDDRHFTLKNGRQVDLVFHDQGALGGWWNVESHKKDGPESERDQERDLKYGFFPELKVLPNDKMTIKVHVGANKFMTFDLDEFLERKANVPLATDK